MCARGLQILGFGFTTLPENGQIQNLSFSPNLCHIYEHHTGYDAKYLKVESRV